MRQHKLFWGSSYDRGLDVLLFMWPEVKKRYPEATLDIAYGWGLFDVGNRTNPERMAWKAKVEQMMAQEGITHHGRVGKDKLAKIRGKCGIWAYPTYFHEINCITALDAQRDGLVPVAMRLGALNETVGSGILVDGDIHDYEVQEQFKDKLIELMGDEEQWNKESKKAQKFAKGYSWKNIAGKWSELFEKPVTNPKVSVCTITIREGFWNLMAENLSRQTYKNFEWVIVDDYPEDRQKIAEKYAKKYDLEIVYIRGDKCLGKYKQRCGLVRANNKAWKASSGELTVWLQDFILIRERGIEDLVDMYRHNKDTLLAPTDMYYHCKKPNLKNKEDWWDGDTDIITRESWRNIRSKRGGIRLTDNALDFEMNWSAIPRHILEELNGWWEFFDQGLGFDNTEIAYRAMQAGYSIRLDDINIAQCIDLWPVLENSEQNITGRERILNTPRYAWMIQEMAEGRMPITRDEKLDKSIKLPFHVPKNVPNEDASKWINDNYPKILKGWNKLNNGSDNT